MKRFLGVLAIIGLLMLVFGLSYLVYVKIGKKESGETNILRFPRISRIVSALCFVVFFGASIYILIFEFKEYWQCALALMCFIALPSLIMFIMCIQWKVEIKDTSFVYRNYFGRKVEYKYDELEYRPHPKGLKWYFYKGDKKVLCIAYHIEKGDVLWKKYKKAKQK